MAAGTWTFTNATKKALLDGTFDLDTDSFKMALHTSSASPSSTSDVWADLGNEVSAANGYTAGGIAANLTVTQSSGTVTVDIQTDPVWTASGGTITARYAVIYETGTGGKILCYSLLDTTPADVSVTSGNTLTIAANASGVFTLA